MDLIYSELPKKPPKGSEKGGDGECGMGNSECGMRKN
jgi:hypothetical protein